jgi:hypothetical protein
LEARERERERENAIKSERTKVSERSRETLREGGYLVGLLVWALENLTSISKLSMICIEDGPRFPESVMTK